jgi:hypothetical protein
VTGAGYQQLDNDGSMDHQRFTELHVGATRVRVAHELVWHTQPTGSGHSGASRGDAVVREERSFEVSVPSDDAWVLTFSTSLTNVADEDLDIGSPTTKGRDDAGYGGLFWRLPPVVGARVWTPDAEGERAAHGSVAPWVAFGAGGERPFTVVLAGADETTRRDPWFVRVDDYPGLGSQLAAAEPVHLQPGASTTRCFRALVVDGTPTTADVETELAVPADGGESPS